ncbi:MAG TPA: hypothetical protein VK205_16225 [Prolixibacteraceae bacterium]|nr:hypothetical protein [Prolixibacteraceae bacterium]
MSLVTREKQVNNLDTAKTAGVLWMTDQKETFGKIQDRLNKAGIKTNGLCYFPVRSAKIPEGINGFTRRQTNFWTEVPSAQLVDNFIHQKFDLLIDLTVNKHFPLVYVAALSEANFKIGYSGSTQNYFDLNIVFQTQPDAEQLAEQILYYLTRINKTTIE